MRVFPAPTVVPWNSHLMVGAGVPTAKQLNSADPLSGTAVGCGATVMIGTTTKKADQLNVRYVSHSLQLNNVLEFVHTQYVDSVG